MNGSIVFVVVIVVVVFSILGDHAPTIGSVDAAAAAADASFTTASSAADVSN